MEGLTKCTAGKPGGHRLPRMRTQALLIVAGITTPLSAVLLRTKTDLGRQQR